MELFKDKEDFKAKRKLFLKRRAYAKIEGLVYPKVWSGEGSVPSLPEIKSLNQFKKLGD